MAIWALGPWPREAEAPLVRSRPSHFGPLGQKVGFSPNVQKRKFLAVWRGPGGSPGGDFARNRAKLVKLPFFGNLGPSATPGGWRGPRLQSRLPVSIRNGRFRIFAKSLDFRRKSRGGGCPKDAL